MPESYVTLDVKKAVGTITFYTPHHNALPTEILKKLEHTITEAGARSDLRVLVIKSGGDRTFCAGASFNELIAIENETQGKDFFMGFARVILAMRKCPLLTIVRVQGKAVGGGVGLAAAADYCMATKYASIKLSEISIGIGPFVIGLLVHVGGKGDPVYGFLMFFVLALGLGLPYLFLGIFSGRLKNLPHSGQWMVTVRQIFGLILLGMALYFLNPLLGSYTSWGLAVLSSISSGYLILVQARRAKPLAFAWTLRLLGAGLALATVLLVITSESKPGISWKTYSERALVQAQQDGKIVMIDVYADWCLPCKELDEFTFTDSEVRSAAQRLVSLKLDLTTTDPDSAEERARERLGILGVPTILFLDSTGREHKELRLEGFEAANLFLARIRRMEASSYPVEQQNSSARKIRAIGQPPMEDL